MTTPPPAAVPVVVVHDSFGAEAAVNYALARNRPLIILYSASIALAGGPAVARAMVPDFGPASLLHILDCGSDAGCARRAMEVGWSHILINETDRQMMVTVTALARQTDSTVWETSIFMRSRKALNLEGHSDPSTALDMDLG